MASTTTADDSADKPPKRNAEECPWYLLATLYGVPRPDDGELQARNRLAWNRLMAARLGEHDFAALRQTGWHSSDELTALTPDETAAIEAAFATRRGDASSVLFPPLTEHLETIDFSNLEFHEPLLVVGFIFPMAVDFSGATFSGNAELDCATFSGYAQFDSVTFAGDAAFSSATFSRDAWFTNVTFSGDASFDNATFAGDAWFTSAAFSSTAWFDRAIFSGTAGFNSAAFSGYAQFDSVTFAGDAAFSSAAFSGYARFNSATLSGDARFNSATFSGSAWFTSAIFHGESWFTNSETKSQTSFETTTFAAWPPRFFGAKLHEWTVWRGVTWPPPPLTAEDAGKFVDAYERLKLEMDRLKKHEDELDFFVLEMRSRRVLYGTWKGLPILLYGLLCDHGRSYVRPIYGLLITIAVGALAFWPHFGWPKPDKAIGLSLANTFGILGFRKDLVAPETIKELSDLLIAIAGLQTVVGAILLFLLGLALRNRFRMK